MIRPLATFLFCLIFAGQALAVQSLLFKSTGQSSASGPPYPTAPIIVELGRDVGGSTTKTGSVRSRGFYIIDRSIPTAFEPGTLHNPDLPLTWGSFTRIQFEHGIPEKDALSPIPALTSADVDFDVVDSGDVQAQFVAMPGLPEGTYHQLSTGPTTIDFSYRVDLGDGGVSELTTHCDCPTGYVLSNVQLTTGGSGSIFHLIFDLDGPGGALAEPMLDCSTTGTFTESVVATKATSWSGIKALYR
jgi:hypothetical protein